MRLASSRHQVSQETLPHRSHIKEGPEGLHSVGMLRSQSSVWKETTGSHEKGIRLILCHSGRQNWGPQTEMKGGRFWLPQKGADTKRHIPIRWASCALIPVSIRQSPSRCVLGMASSDGSGTRGSKVPSTS